MHFRIAEKAIYAYYVVYLKNDTKFILILIISSFIDARASLIFTRYMLPI